MKFICDAMLSSLGKWLRAAGYDTLIIENSMSDKQILSLAQASQRIIITRDCHFLKMNHAIGLIYLKHNDLETNISEINHQIDIDWLHAPFSRCLICNTPFIQPTLERIKLLPERIRNEHSEFWFCPTCQHVYWEGSHTKHMIEQLKFWKNLE